MHHSNSKLPEAVASGENVETDDRQKARFSGHHYEYTPSSEFSMWFEPAKVKYSGKGHYTVCPGCPGSKFHCDHMAYMEFHYFEMHAPTPCPSCLKSCHGMQGYNAHKEICQPKEWDRYESILRDLLDKVSAWYSNMAFDEGYHVDDDRYAGDNCSCPKTHYDILGVARTASQEDIEKAAKSKRIACHPDKLKRKEGLTQERLDAIDEQAKEVGFAAEVLCDRRKRASYDMQLMVFECGHR